MQITLKELMGQKILSLLNASLQDKSKYRIRVFTFRFNATSKVGGFLFCILFSIEKKELLQKIHY